MKDPHFAEQDDGHPASLALADLCAEFAKEGLHVLSIQVGTGRMSEQGFQRALVLPIHSGMVLRTGTKRQLHFAEIRSERVSTPRGGTGWLALEPTGVPWHKRSDCEPPLLSPPIPSSHRSPKAATWATHRRMSKTLRLPDMSSLGRFEWCNYPGDI